MLNNLNPDPIDLLGLGTLVDHVGSDSLSRAYPRLRVSHKKKAIWNQKQANKEETNERPRSSASSTNGYDHTIDSLAYLT